MDTVPGHRSNHDLVEDGDGRWEYYAECPLPEPPEGHRWAVNLTLVDNSFYG